MPTDLTVRSVSAATSARNVDRTIMPETTAETEALAPTIPNPKLRLDSSLGMVVLEFRGNSGEVANTIPSSRIIEAYLFGPGNSWCGSAVNLCGSAAHERQMNS